MAGMGGGRSIDPIAYPHPVSEKYRAGVSAIAPNGLTSARAGRSRRKRDPSAVCALGKMR